MKEFVFTGFLGKLAQDKINCAINNLF